MPSVQNTDLDQRLVLLAWINQQFGYEQNRELLRDMKQAAEGFDPDGRSHVYHRLISRGNAVKIATDELLQYDENIRYYLAGYERPTDRTHYPAVLSVPCRALRRSLPRPIL